MSTYLGAVSGLHRHGQPQISCGIRATSAGCLRSGLLVESEIDGRLTSSIRSRGEAKVSCPVENVAHSIAAYNSIMGLQIKRS